ncbi:MAG TPA: enoyl-[acyl-carrier-protein] reductase FabK [Firmicutes bacterium]|nr:enoyl-[acyl-carrier-protein] reductase FabK [Bacillota bacterium]
MRINTVLCDLLGIQYPIIQGGMAWVATAELAAAVSEAGALGVIGAGNLPPEAVQREIQRVRSLTSKPFGVNVFLLSPFSAGVMEVIVDERVPVVTTGAGNPGKYMALLKAAGVKVLSVVSTVNMAKRLERAGVDAVIAEGMECGGHIGQIASMPLVPQIVDAVEIPVVAAGGIYDGRGLVAALALGASGVQMGTRFVCATECTVHRDYKKAIIVARDRSTVVIGRTTGHPVRVLDNKLARQVLQAETQRGSGAEIEGFAEGALKCAVVDGDTEYGCLMAGQVAAMVTREESCQQIIDHVMATAYEALERLGGVTAG